MTSLPRSGSRVDIHYRRIGRPAETYRQLVLESGPAGIVTFQSRAPIESPAVVDGATILEPGSPVIWFTFAGSWHDIGLFHRADGTFTGVYANILTPVEFVGDGAWATTDLCLDVWVPRSGRARLLDEAELDEAEAASLVDRGLAGRARAEAAALLRDHSAGRWPPRLVGEWSLERAMGAANANQPHRAKCILRVPSDQDFGRPTGGAYSPRTPRTPRGT